MMATPLHVLILADQPCDIDRLLEALCEAGFAPTSRHAGTKAGFLKHIRIDLDLILLSPPLRKLDPTWVLQELRRRDSEIACISFIEQFDEAAFQFMRLGAADCLLKEEPSQLGPAVARAMEARRLRCQLRHAQDAAIALEREKLTGDLRRTTRALTLLEERERVGMDLHDGAIQSLYGVMLNLGAQARTLDGQMDETRAGLQRAIEQLAGVIHEIRTYISGLWSQELGARGLPAGLQTLAEDLRLNARIETQLEVGVDLDDVLEPEAVANVLQIAREAVSNVIRHADASMVTIRVAPAGGNLVLTIRDNGHGFDTNASVGGGQGLRNMAERARRVGGDLSIESSSGQGTEVRLQISLRR